MNIDDIAKILNIIATPAVSIILFYLASIKDKTNSKNNTLRQRNDKLYMPFYQMYCTCLCSEIPFSEQVIKNRSAFLKLFIANINLMSTQSQYNFFNFYKTYRDYYQENGLENEVGFISSQVNIEFKNLSLTLLKEYKDICSKLKLPKPID